MRIKASPTVRFVAAIAAVALSPFARAATPTPPATGATPAFAPLRIRTDALTATGPGTVEAPFSFKTRTDPLTAVGPGTIQPAFKPFQIRTDTLTAQGAATGGPK